MLDQSWVGILMRQRFLLEETCSMMAVGTLIRNRRDEELLYGGEQLGCHVRGDVGELYKVPGLMD